MGGDTPKKRTTSDVYLHGISKNPAHKFRSPAEFFPHLVWLASGEEDRSLCSCKFCGPGKASDPLDQTPRAIMDEGKIDYERSFASELSKGTSLSTLNDLVLI